VMNSRRLIVAPRRSKPRTASSHSRPGLGTGRGGCELRPIVLGWQCRLWVPRPASKPEKLSISRCFSGLPQTADLPPDLRTPPAFCERPHRGLARRRVAVRWRAVLVMAEGERRRGRGNQEHTATMIRSIS